MVFTLGIAMAACEKEDTGGGGDTNSNPDDITKPAEFLGKDIFNEKVTLLYIPIGDQGPAFEAGKYAALDSVKFNKNITIDVKPGEYNPDKQAQIIQEGITANVDGIFIEAMNPEVSAGPIEEAEKAGIPVITINLNSNAVHSLHVQGNDYTSGFQAAQILAVESGGSGKAFTFNGPAEQAETNQMVAGFKDGLEGSGIEYAGDAPVPNWSAGGEARDVMAQTLTANPDITMVYCASDDIADGVIQAIEAAGKTGDILVYGSMGYPGALTNIRSGKQFGTYLSDIYVEYSNIIGQLLYFIQNGINSQSLGLTATPLLDQPTTPITKDGKVGGKTAAELGLGFDTILSVDEAIGVSRWNIVLPGSVK
jgi:ABC-type sugar transport system substrate-binding protein